MTEPVRILGAEDAAAAHALHALCFPPEETWSAWAFKDTLAAATTLALATEGDGRLTGMILVQKTPPEAEILTLAVAPDQRRKGLADTLLSGMIRLLGSYGIGQLFLDVAADNEAAIAFYENSRFKVDGRRRNYYRRGDDVQMDAILMSRSFAGHTTESEA